MRKDFRKFLISALVIGVYLTVCDFLVTEKTYGIGVWVGFGSVLLMVFTEGIFNHYKRNYKNK